MYVPPQISDKLRALSERLNCDLSLVQCWRDEDRDGSMYCRFRGILHDSPAFKFEFAGTLWIAPAGDKDEVDLFVFVNGARLSPMHHGYRYLMGHLEGEFRWDDVDEGFEQFTVLDEHYGTRHIDESMVIQPPENGVG